MSSTVGAALAARAAECGDRTFLVCDDERLTYRQAAELSRERARALIAAGAGRGTHVGILMPNGIDFVVTAFAALRIGAVALPLSTFSTVAELRQLLDRSDCELLVATAGHRGHRFDVDVPAAVGVNLTTPAPLLTPTCPNLRRVVFTGALDRAHPDWTLPPATVDDELLDATECDVQPSDPAVIVHTSGSTSAPKGVVHTHGALLDHVRVLNDLRDYAPDDVLFSNSPFFWIGGFAYTLLGTLLAGATLVCSNAAEAAGVLDVIERERPTMTNGYASAVSHLAADPTFADRDLSSVRRGNLYPIMPPALRPADPQLRTNMLGLTEAGSVALAGTDEKDLDERYRGSFGRPVPDAEARIVDGESDCAPGEVGELWLRGPFLMQGYYGVEKHLTFDRDGWFHTGDLFRRDEDDHWYFEGRGGDVIKTSGANVSPSEVEGAILTLAGITSYVVGVPDADRGHIVAAVLVTADPVDPDALRRLLATELSAYKVPRAFVSVAAAVVPLLSSGKVDRVSLRKLFDAR